MKKYNITVNGTSYDVTVEEAGEVSAAPAPAAPSAPAAKPAPKPAAAGAQGGVKVTAPMPGTIVDVKLQPGAQVKNGTVIAILEAMKMENDIVASCDGTLATVNVTKGQSVETGALIATINA